jgi:hypothetical protein
MIVTACGSFKLQKRRQRFIGLHNETLSVTAMHVRRSGCAELQAQGFHFSKIWSLNRRRQIGLSNSKKAVSFSSTRNETLSIVAMRVNNPDRSPVGINR